MDSSPTLLYKTLVIGVIFLFCAMSVVSSNVGIAEDKSLKYNFLESANNPKNPFSCDHSAYIIGEGPDCYLYEFILNNPSDLNCVCEGSYGGFSSATWSSDNYIYYGEYASGLLIVIDVDSCEMWSIGGGGEAMWGLAYDFFSEQIYGCSYDYLYTINPETGEQDLIGRFDGPVYYMIGMAFNSEGVLYGWDLGTDKLWIINTETAEVTEIGSLGININSVCDGDFCKEDDILYIVHNNYLYSSDRDTGECELYDQFPDNVTVTGLAIPYGYDDTTPPVTTHNLDPPEPDGCNGWYVSNVSVTLNATDDFSGIKEIRYTVNGGVEQIIPGNNGSFIIDEDGNDILIVYWAIDNWGNEEKPHNWFTVDIDQTVPDICLYDDIINKGHGWEFLIGAIAIDKTSGMEKVEFYVNSEYQGTIFGIGPEYEWLYLYPGKTNDTFKIRGFIRNPVFTEENVSFYVYLVRVTGPTLYYWSFMVCGYDNAGNKQCDQYVGSNGYNPFDSVIYLLRNLSFPNNYRGYIGNFFIFATFNTN